MKEIILKKKDGSYIKAQIKELDLSYLNKIMELQDNVYNKLSNKAFYCTSDRDEFNIIFSGKGKIIGCVSAIDDELIAIGVYVEYGYEKHNYGYDINIQGKDLLKVGQVESTIVKEEYRGNKLQRVICKILEEVAYSSGMSYICSTVAPDNIYSLNTFKNLGYNIIIEKLKYNGLNRYVLMKNFNN
ncbi:MULTISPECIES: GNAT family N-acetyltransferase [unclassified Clostridium]|uniref:GNAT family N-acetyltransferase n=1 Tax=unclassified Clostridium TaxID=2614128 RepID=UPI00029804BA|nr:MULTISPECIES: GNAT family N-acetyltransferase [unclassified Clostridium]EKQ57287.1 MAG: acetyltransferase (GNAT) family protein [Clostridium sp. Maddingley MBC34-26]